MDLIVNNENKVCKSLPIIIVRRFWAVLVCIVAKWHAPRVCVKCRSAGADTCKMSEIVWVINRILHIVNGDPLQGKS